MLKLALVVMRYIAAFIIACAVVAVRIAASGPDAFVWFAPLLLDRV